MSPDNDRYEFEPLNEYALPPPANGDCATTVTFVLVAALNIVPDGVEDAGVNVGVNVKVGVIVGVGVTVGVLVTVGVIVTVGVGVTVGVLVTVGVGVGVGVCFTPSVLLRNFVNGPMCDEILLNITV